MQRDVFLGIFIGWLSWLAEPSLVAQGVGAAALNGGMGSSLRSFAPRQRVDRWNHHSCLRFIASWGGPFSNIFGRIGADTFARFMGLVLLPISLWATTNGVLASARLVCSREAFMRVEVNSLEYVSTTAYLVQFTNQFAATLPEGIRIAIRSCSSFETS